MMRSLLLLVVYVMSLVAVTVVQRREEVQAALVGLGWLGTPGSQPCEPLIPFRRKLVAGQSVRGCEGRCAADECSPLTLLAMHHDGALALYDYRRVLWRASPTPWWQRPTFAPDYWAEIQGLDVVIGKAGDVLWTRSLDKCTKLANHIQRSNYTAITAADDSTAVIAPTRRRQPNFRLPPRVVNGARTHVGVTVG